MACLLSRSRRVLHCGVGYAARFRTRMSKNHASDILKDYVCVLVRKAVHIELVRNLSSEAVKTVHWKTKLVLRVLQRAQNELSWRKKPDR